MAQDRSRSAFDVRKPKHWSSVQAQQGRLLSDDDWNEADAIDKEEQRQALADVIGASGSPDDGFKVTNPATSANGIDFTLAPGSLYVGGLRTTLEAPAELFSLQKDWLQQALADRLSLGAAPRIDLVYLEVWQQPVTAVEDDELREVALGGPDTSVRLRSMRRVRVLPNIASESCTAAWTALVNNLGGLGADNELLADASLKVAYLPNNGPAVDLCSPATQAGYLGAENQAIRVEIGAGGNTLLWGYDNASPLYRVQVTKDAMGAEAIYFLTTPKDEVHWPLAQQVVELLPWSAVLPNGEKVAETASGFLTTVSASYEPNAQTIKLTAPIPASFGINWQSRADKASLSSPGKDFYYLRVWGRGEDVTSPPAIAFNPGQAIELRGTGITVTLTGTKFRPGDFWIIAARPESPAKVVPWSLESGRIAEGIRRFYAPLATIHWQPATGLHTVNDCRASFDPLTRPGGCCVTISPKSGWEHLIDEVADWPDLCLCFKPGDYVTTRTLELRNQHVQVHGAGAASRLQATGLETVLRFKGCNSVDIRDLSLQALGQGQPNAPKPYLGGAVTLIDCDHVSISRVMARCASAPIKSSSCIAAYGGSFAGARALESTIRVNGCDLIVGANQVGLSIINYGRSSVSDNSLRVDATENASLPAAWMQDQGFRRVFRRTLIWHHGVGPPPDATKKSITLGNTAAWIDCPPELVESWQQVVRLRNFKPGVNTAMNARKFLYEFAEDLVYANGNIGTRAFAPFVTRIAAMLAVRTAVSRVRGIAAQGIVVGGTTAREVRIVGNTVRDSVQGVHVGVSAQRVQNPGPGAPVSDTAGRVVISNNALYVALMPESVVERHGIFVGNCTSLMMEGNHVECERLGDAGRLPIDGIRVYGFIGRMAYVTRNDMAGFTTGIRFAALNNLADGPSSMWRVTENLAHAAATIVDISLRQGTSSYVAVTGNMS